jgi:hypothetical protein
MTAELPHEGMEIDNVSFVVRAQKFRVAAMIMKRTPLPVATEFATRLVHLVQGTRLEEMAGFFDFEPAESKVLLEDVLGTGLVTERNGQLVLSQRGHEALSPLTDTLELFEVEEITSTISLDLAAFAPVEVSNLNARETRIVEELKLPNREKAASAVGAARDAFELHFQEWRSGHGRRRWLDEDTRLHSIEDVQVVGTFPAVFQIPVRWRAGDPSAIEPDFSELSQKGRAGSRNPLISALSTRLNEFSAPRDHEAAFEVLTELDNGLFRRDGMRSSLEQPYWAALVEKPEHRQLQGLGAPGLRLAGSTSTAGVRSALLDWTHGVGGASTATQAPVFWLPPRTAVWGRSVPFVNLASALSAANAPDDGTVLLARTQDGGSDQKFSSKLYGPTSKLPAIFDRCLAVPATDLPDALEILVKPGAWAMALIHAPDSASGYPFAFGYITASRNIVDRIAYRIAELASRADGTKAVLWTRAGEDAHKALAMMDEALGIGVA